MNHTGNRKSYSTSRGIINILDCDNCGFKHQHPLKKQDYSSDYFNIVKPDFIKEHESDKQWYNKIVFKDIFDTVESYLDTRQRRVLDVGAGWMGFLRYAQTHGWDPVGLDPSLQAYKAAQQENIPFYRGDYDENCLHLGIFDVIHAHEVLEHVVFPIDMVIQAHKQLEQQGIFVVTVPNDFNVLQEAKVFSNASSRTIQKQTWLAREHISYFTMETLGALLTNNGFELLEVRTRFPMEMFLFMGIDYTNNSRTGRRVHGYRKRWELNLEKAGLSSLRKEFDQFWTDRELGRDIIIYARKT